MRSQRANAVVDALGREVSTLREARRVVSLVPSETESLAVVARGLERLVGRTTYCIEPAGAIERVPAIGGTKNVDVAAVLALAPDLVLANQEENTRSDVDALIAAGLRVHVSFPRTLAQSADYLASLVSLLGLEPEMHPVVRRAREALTRRAPPGPARRVWVPIWKDPWMSFDARTFASDVLAHAGLENVMADRARRYPLSADLGERAPVAVSSDRDTRYPRTTLEEALAREPELVLLPDEPYRFTAADADEIRGAAGTRVDVRFVDGKDLFWYGARAIDAPSRLRAGIDAR